MRKFTTILAGSVVAALALTACSSGTETTPEVTETAAVAGEATVVRVGSSPVPHAKILEFVQENLSEEAGITLEITEFDDYVLPNEALSAGDIDANYFQHLPYLEDQINEKGYEFDHGEGIHIEPYALFSEKYDTAAEIPDGAVIAITNDPSNQFRGLKVLENEGLLTGVNEGDSVLTLTDEQNPKGLKFEENQPEVIVQQLSDPAIDAAFVNGNFILTAGLNTDDAIAVEPVAGNPYANVLVWQTGTDNQGVAVLEELLHSPEVIEYIQQEYPSGDVIPGTAS